MGFTERQDHYNQARNHTILWICLTQLLTKTIWAFLWMHYLCSSSASWSVSETWGVQRQIKKTGKMQTFCSVLLCFTCWVLGALLNDPEANNQSVYRHISETYSYALPSHAWPYITTKHLGHGAKHQFSWEINTQRSLKSADARLTSRPCALKVPHCFFKWENKRNF